MCSSLRTRDKGQNYVYHRFEISMDESIRQDDVFLEPAIYSISELNDPLRVDLEYMKNVGVIYIFYHVASITCKCEERKT